MFVNYFIKFIAEIRGSGECFCDAVFEKTSPEAVLCFS